MTNEELNELIAKIATSAKQVNVLTGDHASVSYNEAAADRQATTRSEEA